MKPNRLWSVCLCLATIVIFLQSCSDTQGHGDRGPDQLVPPLNLIAFAGDQQVVLTWDSANHEEEKYPPTGFSIYIAEGDFTDSDCAGPINKYQLTEDGDEDVGPICSDLGANFSQNGELNDDIHILPAILDEISKYTVPGTNSRLIVDGEPMTDLSMPFEDDTSAEAESTDRECSLHSSTAVSQTAVSTPGTIQLENGVTYTFFVTTKAYDDFSGESYTSDWAAETPRAEIDNTPLAVGDCYDFDSLSYETACTDTSDITVEFIDQQYPVVLISGINEAQIMDAGAVVAFDDVGEAPDIETGGYLPVGAGVVARPGHVYVVYTDSGYYAKMLITQMTDLQDIYENGRTECHDCSPTGDTKLLIRAALQTGGRLLKK